MVDVRHARGERLSAASSGDGLGGQERPGCLRRARLPSRADSTRLTATCISCSGSGLDTGQSLPNATRAPRSGHLADPVLPGGALWADEGMVRFAYLVVLGTPTAAGSWRPRRAGRTCPGRRADELQVRDVVPAAGPLRRRAASRCVSSAAVTARSPIAWKCSWKPRSASAPAASPSSSGSMNRLPWWPVGCPWPSRYGGAHRGGERLAHPVEHHLDRGGAEVRRPRRRPRAGSAAGRAGRRPRCLSHHSEPVTRQVSSRSAAARR